MTSNLCEYMTKQLASELSDIERYNSLFDADAPLGYIDPEVRKAYGSRLTPVNINLARLAVQSITQRLQVTGFRSAVGDVVDNEMTALWRALGMDTASALAHVEALVSGRAYFMVGTIDGRPVVTPESPRQVTVTFDPITRVIDAALKRYRGPDGHTRSVVMTAEVTETYVSRNAAPSDPAFNYGATALGDDMVLESSVPGEGYVPVRGIFNRPRLNRPLGQSELVDLEAPLTAISKLASDMMVASEAAALRRLWTSFPGEVTSEQARTIQDSVDKTLTAPGGTKTLVISAGGTLNEVSTADLNNFDTAIRLLISSVASIASLPSHFVSADVASPTSADSIRASAARITDLTLEKARLWGPAYCDVMRMAVLARDGRADPRLDDLTCLFADPAPASVAQEADAAVKLYAAGITDRRAALEALNLEPLEVERLLAEMEAAEAAQARADVEAVERAAAAAHVTPPEPRTIRKAVERDAEGYITAVVETTN